MLIDPLIFNKAYAQLIAKKSGAKDSMALWSKLQERYMIALVTNKSEKQDYSKGSKYLTGVQAMPIGVLIGLCKEICPELTIKRDDITQFFKGDTGKKTIKECYEKIFIQNLKDQWRESEVNNLFSRVFSREDFFKKIYEKVSLSSSVEDIFQNICKEYESHDSVQNFLQKEKKKICDIIEKFMQDFEPFQAEFSKKIIPFTITIIEETEQLSENNGVQENKLRFHILDIPNAARHSIFRDVRKKAKKELFILGIGLKGLVIDNHWKEYVPKDKDENLGQLKVITYDSDQLDPQDDVFYNAFMCERKYSKSSREAWSMLDQVNIDNEKIEIRRCPIFLPFDISLSDPDDDNGVGVLGLTLPFAIIPLGEMDDNKNRETRSREWERPSFILEFNKRDHPFLFAAMVAFVKELWRQMAIRETLNAIFWGSRAAQYPVEAWGKSERDLSEVQKRLEDLKSNSLKQPSEYYWKKLPHYVAGATIQYLRDLKRKGSSELHFLDKDSRYVEEGKKALNWGRKLLEIITFPNEENLKGNGPNLDELAGYFALDFGKTFQDGLVAVSKLKKERDDFINQEARKFLDNLPGSCS
ncbi:MAG: hypothetical protein LBG04_01935 [Holosporaceae bacterium]|jgi:hypothetical protein|nr:hypothetical protein [Holosporaceae bacterium]